MGSERALIRAFAMGFRCVEIDIWVRDKTLVVTHGFTMVNNWHLSRAFEAILNYGFKWSDSPLYISIENHIEKDYYVLFM